METKVTGIWNYIIATYIVFWLMLVVVGGVASMLEVPDIVMRFVVVLCSWAPTITLVILFKKLEPDKTLKSFYKNLFHNRFSIVGVIVIGLIMFLISFLTFWILSGKDVISSVTVVPSVIALNMFFAITQGASGEESGWRGYLLPKMEAKYGFFKGNLILGTVWGFWHLPLWFLSGEYGGIDLVLYIIYFMVTIIALSFFIGIIMRKYSNLFIAFWIHFIFNFSVSFYQGDLLELLSMLMPGYLILVIGALLIFQKEVFRKER